MDHHCAGARRHNCKTEDPLLLVLLNISPHKTHTHTKDIRRAAVHVPFSFNFIDFVVVFPSHSHNRKEFLLLTSTLHIFYVVLLYFLFYKTARKCDGRISAELTEY